MSLSRHARLSVACELSSVQAHGFNVGAPVEVHPLRREGCVQIRGGHFRGGVCETLCVPGVRIFLVMLRAPRKVDARAKQAAIADKLRDVLMPSQRKKNPKWWTWRNSVFGFRKAQFTVALALPLYWERCCRAVPRTYGCLPSLMSFCRGRNGLRVVGDQNVNGDVRLASVGWYGVRAGVCRLPVV